MKNLDDMVEAFEFLGTWDQRYQFLIDLGEKLPPMPDAFKTEDNRVRGCMSQVWTKAYVNQPGSSMINFYGDCDTSIIKGVLALLLKLASGKTAAQIDTLNLDELFKRLKLDEHLSPNRHVGIYAIVKQMKQQAQNLDFENQAST